MTAFDLPTVGTPSAQKPDARTINDGGTDVMRQVVVVGDPATAGNVASVDAIGALQVKARPVDKWKWSFAKVVAANGIDTEFGTLLQTGAGMAVSQANGNLVITTGTTTYSETVIRSLVSFSGPGKVRYGLTLSQRIANQNFVVEFVDIIGDDLSFTINSATSITVTKVGHGFTSADVGKGMWIGKISVASCLTQRAVIASVPTADTITFTVSGFPASGSGTCNLFGYNYHQVIYSGTTATALGTGYSTQRLGWQNTPVNATVQTTASGHIGILATTRNTDAEYLDQIQGSGTGTQIAQRAVMNQNVPDADVEMYLQIRVFNGSTAPASTTTLTMAFVDAELYNPLMVGITAVEPQTTKNPLPVIGGVTATGVAGAAAHDAAISGNPVRLAGRALTAHYTAVATGDVADLVTTLVGALVTRPFAIPEQDWVYAAASGGIVNTTDVAIAAAAGAGLRRYLTGISIQNASATVATEVVIKDGSTVIWRGYVGTSALLNSAVSVVLPTPLKTTANTALNVACITTGAAVYVNAQGYTAP